MQRCLPYAFCGLCALFSSFVSATSLDAQSQPNPQTESCPQHFILDCTGHCVSANFIKENLGDGVCNEETLNLNCPQFEKDEGDCFAAEDDEYEISISRLGTLINSFAPDGRLRVTVELLDLTGEIITYDGHAHADRFKYVCNAEKSSCSLWLNGKQIKTESHQIKAKFLYEEMKKILAETIDPEDPGLQIAAVALKNPNQ